MTATDYTLNDVKAAAKRVRAACPDVILDRSGDYGFKLVGYKRAEDGAPFDALILFQPDREENGQQLVISDIDAAIKHWGGTP